MEKQTTLILSYLIWKLRNIANCEVKSFIRALILWVGKIYEVRGSDPEACA